MEDRKRERCESNKHLFTRHLWTMCMSLYLMFQSRLVRVLASEILFQSPFLMGTWMLCLMLDVTHVTDLCSYWKHLFLICPYSWSFHRSLVTSSLFMNPKETFVSLTSQVSSPVRMTQARLLGSFNVVTFCSYHKSVTQLHFVLDEYLLFCVYFFPSGDKNTLLMCYCYCYY